MEKAKMLRRKILISAFSVLVCVLARIRPPCLHGYSARMVLTKYGVS